MTREKIYYQDNHITTFTATIFECEKEGDRYAIGLDRTAFYPEGGGQPSDRGMIGKVPVLHVAKGDEFPIHYVGSPIEPGTDVICQVDWEHRFEYMQQHTGQHILSAILMKEGDWSTVSVHQGEETLTIEVEASDISDLELYSVEREANRVISQNIAIQTEWVRSEDLKKFTLRRPSKVKGEVRLVTIPQVDCVPCGGIHNSTTGDVGLILYVGQERVRSRVRTHWKVGERAFLQARENQLLLTQLGQKYAVPPRELPQRLEVFEKEIYKKEGTINQQKEELLTFYLKDLRQQIDSKGVLTATVEVKDKTFLQEAALSLLEKDCSLLALINRQGEDLQWIVGIPSESSFDFDTFKQDMLPLIEGKGGGRSPLWQGKGRGNREDEFFRALRTNYKEQD